MSKIDTELGDRRRNIPEGEEGSKYRLLDGALRSLYSFETHFYHYHHEVAKSVSREVQ